MALLNHIAPLPLLLLLIASLHCQSFHSGIAHLSPSAFVNSSQSASYSLNYRSDSHDLILSLSSFVFKSTTSCHITATSSQQTNFTCSGNIRTISYLYYEKTPLIYSDIYTHYFFKGNTQYSAVWSPPLNLTIIQRPQLRAILSGFTIDPSSESYNTYIDLNPINGTKVNISRSWNVRVVNISFILIQNYKPYNLTFVDVTMSTYSQMTMKGSKISYLNFWGLQKMKKGTSSNQTYIKTQINQAIATDSNILSITSFAMSANLVIDGLFMINNHNAGSLDCGMNSYFAPELDSCVDSCVFPLAIVQWNTTQSAYRYCLAYNLTEGMGNASFVGDNLHQMELFKPFGCQIWSLAQNIEVVCDACSRGFKMVNQNCVCEYGSYLSSSSCHFCMKNNCEVDVQSSWEVIEEKKQHESILIQLALPTYLKYLSDPSQPLDLDITVNGANVSSKNVYNSSQKMLNIKINNIVKKDLYQISIKSSSKNQTNNPFFHIKMSDKQFLWMITHQLTIKSEPATSQNVVRSIAPVFTDTDKSIPFLMAVTFFLGNKINTISIFQTVSLIYLVNFIEIGQQYSTLTNIISDIFIFQPKPLFHVTGRQESMINIPAVNSSLVGYNPLVQKYTQGQLFISLSFNNVLTLLVQISLIIATIKIIKKLLSTSSNQVTPQNQTKVTFQRSKLQNKEGNIKWLTEVRVRQCASRRFKLWIYFCTLDDKKRIAVSALLMMQLLSLSFFIFYQFTVPILGAWSIASKILCCIVLLVIIMSPFFMYSYESLYLHKCLSITYKRRKYTKPQLWLYFFMTYSQNMLHPLIVLTDTSSKIKFMAIVVILLLKLIILKSVIKGIQFLKTISLVLFFGSLFISCFVGGSGSTAMIQIIISTLLLVISVEVLKIIRGVIVMILSFFKDDPKEPQAAVEQKVKLTKQDPVLMNIEQNTQPLLFNNLQENTSAGPILKQNKNHEKTAEISLDKPKAEYRSRAFRRNMKKQNN